MAAGQLLDRRCGSGTIEPGIRDLHEGIVAGGPVPRCVRCRSGRVAAYKPSPHGRAGRVLFGQHELRLLIAAGQRHAVEIGVCGDAMPAIEGAQHLAGHLAAEQPARGNPRFLALRFVAEGGLRQNGGAVLEDHSRAQEGRRLRTVDVQAAGSAATMRQRPRRPTSAPRRRRLPDGGNQDEGAAPERRPGAPGLSRLAD